MILGTYIIAINALTLGLFGLDKYLAVKHLWRIPEGTLLLSAFLGGSLGAILGMQGFRHKTKKAKFRIGIPVLLAANIVTFFYIGKMWSV